MTLQKLTATELPESVYHGEEYKDFVSGSELWAYIDKCPAEYVYGERKETQSLITGSAVHSEVLEMHSFDKLYYRGFEPDEDTLTSDASVKSKLKQLGVSGYSTKSGRELWNLLLDKEPEIKIQRDQDEKLEAQNKGKTMIKFSDYDMAKAMRDQLMQYPMYSCFVSDGECESSIVGESSIFNCKVKVRPDIIHENSGRLINYKTTTSAKPSFITRQCFDKGYWMKEVFNTIVYLEYIGSIESIQDFELMINYEDPDGKFITDDCHRICIMAQSKHKPYVCSFVAMTNIQVDIGLKQLVKAFSLWSQCKEKGVVTDYCQGQEITTETPQYMLNV